MKNMQNTRQKVLVDASCMLVSHGMGGSLGVCHNKCDLPITAVLPNNLFFSATTSHVSTTIQRIRRRHVYLYRATNIQKQPSTIAAVVPQNPIMLSSRVDFKFMPNIPAIIAPMPAANPAMDSVSSSRFTCIPPDAATGDAAYHIDFKAWHAKG